MSYWGMEMAIFKTFTKYFEISRGIELTREGFFAIEGKKN